eukprot:TRINITY_DN44873_c0_g1_i5.p1 TRINITY_DN44873_c0_g1~~TRINITY_DN44873_c0_g1_i5.p1  ORF type:complete len:1301 (+),score=289.20 TRINITY_DN44873_c0_g1_i5:51-3953(+)
MRRCLSSVCLVSSCCVSFLTFFTSPPALHFKPCPTMTSAAAAASAIWKWAQASPAVRIVSRKVDIEGDAENAEEEATEVQLHDAALSRSFLRGRSEDAVFAQDELLARNLRRGLSFLERRRADLAAAGEKEISIARRGLPKFFDIDVDSVEEALSEASADRDPASQRHLQDSQDDGSRSASTSLARGLCEAWAKEGSVSIVILHKANGENAQVSYCPSTGRWVCCSKHVSMLLKSRGDLSSPQWSDKRYKFAKIVAEVWFQQLGTLSPTQLQALKEKLTNHTAVGELLGGSSHLVDCRDDKTIQWFALVPTDREEACNPPHQALDFFKAAGLPVVAIETRGNAAGHSSRAEFVDALRSLAEETEHAPLAVIGEGYVVYFVSQSKDADGSSSMVVGLGKLKSAEYRILRRLREKAKHFARAAGSLLVEDAVRSFEKDSSKRPAEKALASGYISILGSLCRYIFAEDVPVQTVDEEFLEILDRAKAYMGSSVEPRPPAKLVCVVTPPLLFSKQQLQAIAAASCEDVDVEAWWPAECRLREANLSAAWQRSASSQGAIYIHHVPHCLEGTLSVDASGTALGPPRKKRRQASSLQERQAASSDKLAAELRQKRCRTVFCGWSDELLASALQKAAAESFDKKEAATSREVGSFLQQRRKERAALLKLWRDQALTLFETLRDDGADAAVWLPDSPALSKLACSGSGDPPPVLDKVALSGNSMATSAESPGQRSEKVEGHGSNAEFILTVLMPVGLPGMGKSSLLGRLYRRYRQQSVPAGRPAAFMNGAADTTHVDGEVASDAASVAAVALLSSDYFTGIQLDAAGIDRSTCSSAEMARCRRRANEQYRRGLQDFMDFAKLDAARRSREPSHAGKEVHYILILDKNHPPDELRREAAALAAATPKSLELRMKSIVLLAQGCPASVQALEDQEVRKFCNWAYPWGPDVVAECAARLQTRVGHDTMTGGEMSLFVLLSFLQLYAGITTEELGTCPGIEAIRLPYISLREELAALPYLGGLSEAATWQRYEVRALLAAALSDLRAFGDIGACTEILTALLPLLTAAGRRSIDEASIRRHADDCVATVYENALAKPAPQTNGQPSADIPVVAALRYVAVMCEAHYDRLELALEQAAAASAAALPTASQPPGEPLAKQSCKQVVFPTPPFQRPEPLHLTTLFVGGAAGLSEAQRRLLTMSKKLHREATVVSLRISHIVCVRGALAFAVVDTASVSPAAVLSEDCRAHITLRTRPPWKAKQCNDVLAAVSSHCTDKPGGCWLRAVRIAGGIVDVFVYRLPHSLVLERNPLCLF